ncbi:MAG: relaxase, partial [Selenomonadaceae bacterium]|nr:relaxase [Selenomonadaceae bacterium]
GATVDTIITIEDRSNRNAHFVAVSRARTEGVIFTTNRQRLEKAADEWANKVTADSFRPPTTEKGEYRTKEERAAFIRGLREPSGIEIEKLKEQEKYLGHPLQLEEIRSHAEPEFVLLQNMDEEKELLNAYEQLGKNKLPFEIDRATINNESVAIDKNGKEYLFPASKFGELPANGKEMAQQLANDLATLRQAAQNPFLTRMQLEALPAGARIIAAGQLAASNHLLTPQMARSCKVPGLPAFEKANAVLGLPEKTAEKTMEFTASKVMEALSYKAATLTVLSKGLGIENSRGGISR